MWNLSYILSKENNSRAYITSLGRQIGYCSMSSRLSINGELLFPCCSVADGMFVWGG